MFLKFSLGDGAVTTMCGVDPCLLMVQGLGAAGLNPLSAGVIGLILLNLYSKTRAKKGSLTKE